MDPLFNNFCALLEAITSEKEYLPEHLFIKYGLLNIGPQYLKEVETMEMKRLHYEEKVSLRKIGQLFSLTDSGVYRRIQAFNRREGLVKKDKKKAI